MNFQKLAAELVRVRRGNLTQQGLSKALGYKSNVLFAWENQHDQPSARNFFRLVEKTGAQPSLQIFCRAEVPDMQTSAGVAQFLHDLVADRKMSELSDLLNRDRYAVGRWVRGKTDIPLSDFLHFIEVTTLMLFEFIELFADPEQLPEGKEAYRRLVAARRSARDTPWAHAVIHLADLPSYRALPKHQPGWFASRLGVTTKEEELCLHNLVESGALSLCDGRYRRTEALTVDTRADPDGTRRLAAFWLNEGARRVLVPGSGRFAFNTFAVSAADLDKIQDLQSEYFRKLRAIVAQSEPTEAVAVATFQLLPLGVDRPDECSTGNN